jgi:PTS system sucrose-specific IIC component
MLNYLIGMVIAFGTAFVLSLLLKIKFEVKA